MLVHAKQFVWAERRGTAPGRGRTRIGLRPLIRASRTDL